MGRGRIVVAAALLAATAAAPAHALDSPAGQWLTQDRDAVIAIEPCGTGLCGRIAGVTLDKPTDPVPLDNHGRTQCHLTIISDIVPDGDVWAARILDPRDGSVYRSTLRLDEQRRLRVRGYIGIPLFGQTQLWTPFRTPVPADCRLPPL